MYGAFVLIVQVYHLALGVIDQIELDLWISNLVLKAFFKRKVGICTHRDIKQD